LNIASLAGRNYFPLGAAYCSSKAGLVAFSESLMLEVRADNSRVSGIMRRTSPAHQANTKTRRGSSQVKTSPKW
jgi:short-subunit dehydrogenase